ncbi:MAG: FHA domain-containing protein [Chloroflexi bacterium]|nr:FHA domain-containing protein [Chloroflexota bacterium]
MNNPDDKKKPEGASGSTRLTAIKTCPRCGKQNRPGVFLCEFCGTNLLTGEGAAGTRSLGGEENKTLPAPPAARPAEPPRTGGTVFETQMQLRVEIPGAPAPIMLAPAEERELLFGRLDATANIVPDIDFTPHAAYQLGISRKHAAVILKNKQLYIKDLRSSNGTFVNNIRLVPFELYPLRSGDEVKLGQLVIKVFFAPNSGTPQTKTNGEPPKPGI